MDMLLSVFMVRVLVCSEENVNCDGNKTVRESKLLANKAYCTRKFGKVACLHEIIHLEHFIGIHLNETETLQQ